MSAKNHTPQRTREAGFTLVEMMVGLTIALFLSAVMSILFANASKNRSELEKSNRQLENGRYAMEILKADIENSGYWGPFVPDTPTMTRSDACVTSGFGMSNNTGDMPIALFGHEQGSAPTCASAANSDVLVIRRLSTQGKALSALAATGNPLYVQTSNCAKEIETSKTITLSTTKADFTLKEKDCSTVRPVNKFLSRVYYVDGSDFTLKRKDMDDGGNTLNLVEGIEYMKIEYSLDRLDGDGNPATGGIGDGVADTHNVSAAVGGTAVIVDSCAATAPAPYSQTGYCWANVVGVHIYLLARNTEPSPGFENSPAAGRTYQLGLGQTAYSKTYTTVADKQYKRHVYSAYISSQSTIARRQTP